MIDLQGKNALVCGSTQGIGRACAEVLAVQRARVTLAARDEAGLRSVCQRLDQSNAEGHDYLCADFSDPPSLLSKVNELLRQGRTYHILVNNTGGPPAGPVLDATPEQFLAAMTAHLICNQLLVQALVPGMKQARYGRIINIISISVKTPIPDLGVSNTTRGAVASWAKTLATELAPFGITVNNVLPGYTDTERLKSLMEQKARKAGVEVGQIRDNLIASVPAGRFATPREIAWAVAFLASPEAAYVNGINLPVDGGRLPTL